MARVRFPSSPPQASARSSGPRRPDVIIPWDGLRIEEEARGGRILAWLAGSGAVDIFNVADQAVLMELASGQQELPAMCHAGRDDEVTHILCETIATLHKASESSVAPAEVVPLSLWFRELVAPATVQIRAQNTERGAAVARELLDGSGAHEAVVLRGDVHPGNVPDFDGRWLATDPKGLLGPRGFDFANIFCNPDTDLALSN